MIKVDFKKGIDASDYLLNLKFYRSIVRSLVDAAQVEEAPIAEVEKASQSYIQPFRATAMTEDWCGNSACNLPILSRLFFEAEIPFLVFHGSEYPELKKYYNDMGIDHIPVISFWDGSGREIGHWVEQPAAIIPRKDQWKAEHPEFMELYPKRKTDKDAGKRFSSMYRKLLELMAGWYKDGMWKETTREIMEILKEKKINKDD